MSGRFVVVGEWCLKWEEHEGKLWNLSYVVSVHMVKAVSDPKEEAYSH